jgi:large-conductance mechanosensitive channel
MGEDYMFGSDVLDVGIGMSLLFLMMSLIATAVREAIEGIMKSRSKDLERGLREMLNDTGKASYGGLVGQIYKHPLINSLYRGTLDKAKKNDLPSYIPSKTFVAALLDIVLKSGPAAGGVAKPGAALAEKNDRTSLTIDGLKSCAANLPPQIKRIVLGAIDDAQGDINAVRKNLEGWFDATMDRVSGWYRRRTQLILFLIGIAAAVFLNVDSITIAQRLTNDKTLREGIVATAQRQGTAPAANTTKSYDELSAELGKIGFPIGWTTNKVDGWIYPEAQMCPGGTCDFAWGTLLKVIVGWFVTAFAIMLGAPFWFDVLNRFMVVRSTVKPSEKSQAEGSKDAAPTPLAILMQPAGGAPAVQPPGGAPGN